MSEKDIKKYIEEKKHVPLVNLKPLMQLRREYKKATKADKGLRYVMITIEDIIERSISAHKAKDKKCSEIDDDIVRYRCKIKTLDDKIKELQRNMKYCKQNQDPKVCKLRIVEQIAEFKEQIIGLNKKITNVKIENIKDDNAREADPRTYYSNEYLPRKDRK